MNSMSCSNKDDHRVGAFALLIALALTPVTAAENLQQAWQSALADNQQLRAGASQLAAAETRVKQAQAARLPQLVFSSEYQQLNQNPSLRGDALAAIPGIGGVPSQTLQAVPFELQIADDKAHQFGAIATLPLYSSGRINSGIKAAEAGVQAAQSQQSQLTADIKLTVAKAFLAVLQAQEAKAAAFGHAETLRAHLNDAKNLYNQGLVSTNDVLSSEVSLSNAKQTLLGADKNLALAKAQYNLVLNRPLDKSVSLEKPDLQNPTQDLAALTAQALSSRPALSALQQQISALQFRARGERARTKPQLSLNGAFRDVDNDLLINDQITSVGVSLVWPLFDGGSARQRSAEFNHQAAALLAQWDAEKKQIELQVRTAWLDLNEAQRRIETIDNALRHAEDNLRITQNRYREGLSSNGEVIDAEALRQLTLSNRNSAALGLLQALLQLRWASGSL